jgi:two-component system, LytTR family, response regulator
MAAIDRGPTPTLRTVIVEDELPSRARLRAQLREYPDIELVGEADAVGTGAELVRQSRPQVLFLDIRLSGGSAFHLLQQVADPLPIVVFVTAFGDYAVRAFEIHAVDYLLKPVDRPRLDRCIERIRDRASSADYGGMRAMLQQALEQALARAGPGSDAVSDRIVAYEEGRMVVVDPAQIDYIEADRNYAWFHCGARRLHGRYTLNELSLRLDPRRFSRTHRSLIVNLSRIQSLERTPRGGVLITLQSGDRISCGDSYRRRLLDLLGVARR